MEILIHTNTTIHTNLNRMKNKNYSCFEYTAEEREDLESIYNKSFPDQIGNFFGKDLQENSSERIMITDFDASKGVALGETPFGQTIIIDIRKEEKHMRKLGYPSIEITSGQILDVVIHKDLSGAFNGSVSAGYEKALKAELHRSIKEEDCAFKVKVKNVCNGGFMVDLSGIECFLPGSLAAANRIMNFADYVGKQLTVMVEIYDSKRDIFVVSFKKYLKKIIDGEVKGLSFSSKYQGNVTGASGNGVFVEWDDIFTGIIPIDDSNREKLSELKSGDSIEFYVIDIKNPHRVGLSLLEPNEKLQTIQKLKDTSAEALGENIELQIYKGEVTKLKTFGVFVKLENGLSGLIEKERLVNPIKDYEVGQLVNCSISRVDLSSLKIQLIEQK